MTKKKSSTHYINNEDFLKDMIAWKATVKEAAEVGEKSPPITQYIGTCFLQIAQNLAKKPNFINYPFKEDMIGDAVENCLMYCGNFDPSKSHNPFSYFTQITYFAFLRRIQKEKKQNFIKYKYLQTMDIKGNISDFLKQIGIHEEEIENYKLLEQSAESKPARKKKKKPDIFQDEV
jgi:hypothetical protein